MVTTTCFWVMSGTNVAIDPLQIFTQTLSVFGLIQSFHSSLTPSMCYHKYNEWLYKVEIGIHYVCSLPQTLTFELLMVMISVPHTYFCSKFKCVCTNWALENSLTLSISQYKYNKWSYKVEIGGQCLQWSPQTVFESREGTNVARSILTFHTKIECDWTDSSISQQLDPFNVLWLV